MSEVLPIQRRTPVPFKLGQIRITQAAESLLKTRGITAAELLTRHQSCDFGTLSLAEQRANLRALLTGSRVCSAYPIKDQAVFVITDPTPRLCTTLCLEEELP